MATRFREGINPKKQRVRKDSIRNSVNSVSDIMAKLTAVPKLDYDVEFTVNESEARALDALVGYGDEAFLAHFYKLGEHYMKPHEEGLRSFFKTIRNELAGPLSRLNTARQSFKE